MCWLTGRIIWLYNSLVFTVQWLQDLGTSPNPHPPSTSVLAVGSWHVKTDRACTFFFHRDYTFYVIGSTCIVFSILYSLGKHQVNFFSPSCENDQLWTPHASLSFAYPGITQTILLWALALTLMFLKKKRWLECWIEGEDQSWWQCISFLSCCIFVGRVSLCTN